MPVNHKCKISDFEELAIIFTDDLKDKNVRSTLRVGGFDPNALNPWTEQRR